MSKKPQMVVGWGTGEHGCQGSAESAETGPQVAYMYTCWRLENLCASNSRFVKKRNAVCSRKPPYGLLRFAALTISVIVILSAVIFTVRHFCAAPVSLPA